MITTSIDIASPAYRHRVWMNSTIFSMKGKKYIILEGVTICQNHEAVDAIKFAPVMPAQENDYPIPVYAMSEQEFFSKVTL